MRLGRCFQALLCWIALACAHPAASAQGKPAADVGQRYALVIGNSSYRHATTLLNPVNDSRALCAALKDLRFKTSCHENLPDRRKLREAVRAFTQQLKPEDVALFYFAGHGVEVDGENYLIPTEADMPERSYVEDEALRLGFIFDELRASRVRLSILILDACRNNPFEKVRAATGSGLSAPASLPAGSILIFPTAPGKVASDGAGRNGLFTSHVLQHIRTAGITIEEMFKRVIDGVRTETARSRFEQVPWMNLSFTGEFCFVGCGTRVSTDQYLALVRDKEQIEQVTAELQARLAERQDEVARFRQQVHLMEARLSRQQQDASLSRSERETLLSEREALTVQTAKLSRQQSDIARVYDELALLKREQAEYQARQAQMAMASTRIVQLEQQLAQQEERKIVLQSAELDSVRRERAQLLEQQQRNQQLQAQLQDSRLKLERLQAELAVVDQQQRELDQYRQRVSRLESEGRSKDVALAALRVDLETRQQELTGVHKRLAELQQQLQATAGDARVTQATAERLREERNGLVESSRLLAERERELKLLREQLVQLELQQTRPQAAGMQRDVEVLQARLKEYDQQQQQLNAYKSRLAEAESLLKDAAAAAVKRAAFVAPVL
jgi:uncharacterized caspase-like protein